MSRERAGIHYEEPLEMVFDEQPVIPAIYQQEVFAVTRYPARSGPYLLRFGESDPALSQKTDQARLSEPQA